MPQIPFPHIVSSRQELMKNILRVVTDEIKGDSVYEFVSNIKNPNTEKVEAAYEHYKFEKIDIKRPAKGDWSKWKCHPTYYEGTGSKQPNLVFQSEM